MKYSYAYKTCDGARHEATMNAESREAVFQALRQQGIKAIKVVAADGSKANGAVWGVRKRAVAALVALVAVGVGAFAYWGGTRTGAATAVDLTKMSPRHQIYGDPAIVERFEAGDFEGVLTRTGDQLLAWYAQPGKLMIPKGANPRRLTVLQLDALDAFAKTELAAECDLDASGDTQREVRELKQIVNGLRDEFREYLTNGNGTPRSFWRRLNERTQQEMQIYERTRRELEKETSATVWDEKNEQLRRLGLRTIPNTREEN